MKTKEDLDKMSIPEFFDYMSTLHKVALLIANNMKGYCNDPDQLINMNGLKTFQTQMQLAEEIEKEANFAKAYLDEYTDKAIEEAKKCNEAAGFQ